MLRNQAGSSKTIHEKPGIFPIHIDTIEPFLGEEKRPLFIAVLRKDHDLVNMIRQLEDIASAFEKEDILVCYALDDLLPYFMNRFGIGGTPTFIMISSGVITGTMLGRNENRTIMQFIRQKLEHYGKVPGEGRTRNIRKPGKKASGKR